MIAFDFRWKEGGIARFASEVAHRIPGMVPLQSSLSLFHPLDPFWLSHQLRLGQYSAYFSPGFNPPWRTRTPFLFTIHDLNYLECTQNSDFMRRSYFELIVRPACKRAAFVFTVSNYSRARILEWAGIAQEKVVTVGGGVGPEFGTLGERFTPGYPYILFVGNHLPHKNLPKLLRAFATSRVDCMLLMTGTPSNTLRDLIARLGLTQRVKFLGHVASEQLPALYRGAIALAFPSLYEGFGLPIIEAMACGTPVLTSTVTAMPETAGDAALLVDPESESEIARGIERIVQDSALRSELRMRGVDRALLFTWEKTANSIRSVLNAVISAR